MAPVINGVSEKVFRVVEIKAVEREWNDVDSLALNWGTDYLNKGVNPLAALLILTAIF